MHNYSDLPQYRSHKVVNAAKIDRVVTEACELPNYRYVILSEFGRIACEEKMFTRYVPVPGDYFVVYEDGYQSFSPKDAFEGGYARELRGDEVSPWQPTTYPLTLKHLGKLAEEYGELGAIIARCIIQGIDERDPKTGKVNRIALQEGCADVTANIGLVNDHLGFDRAAFIRRVEDKTAKLHRWHSGLSVKRD